MKANITDFQEYNFLRDLETLSFVDEIWLYGSRARGDNQERSDIDLAIVCPAASDVDWLKVMDIIEEADTLLKIDCLRFDTLSKDNPLYINIMKDRKILYKRGG